MHCWLAFYFNIVKAQQAKKMYEKSQDNLDIKVVIKQQQSDLQEPSIEFQAKSNDSISIKSVYIRKGNSYSMSVILKVLRNISFWENSSPYLCT